MAALNPNIILAGDKPDYLGSFTRGVSAREVFDKQKSAKAKRNFLKDYGADLYSGDEGALEAYSQHDLEGAMALKGHFDQKKAMAARAAQAGQARQREKELASIQTSMGNVEQLRDWADKQENPSVAFNNALGGVLKPETVQRFKDAGIDLSYENIETAGMQVANATGTKWSGRASTDPKLKDILDEGGNIIAQQNQVTGEYKKIPDTMVGAADAKKAQEIADEKNANDEAKVNLGKLDLAWQQGPEAYAQARANNPELPEFEDYEQYRKEEMIRLETPTVIFDSMREKYPDKAKEINKAAEIIGVFKTNDTEAWAELTNGAGLGDLPMDQRSLALYLGVVTGDTKGALAALAPEGEGEGGGQTVAEQTKLQEIARYMENYGMTREEATDLEAGFITTTKNEITGEVSLVNKRTGVVRKATPADADLVSEVEDLPGSGTGDTPVNNAGAGFGTPGALKNAANIAFGSVFGSTPFPDVAESVAAFEVLKESLTSKISGTYGQRVPSWLMENIQNLTPTPASFAQGVDKAKSKLNALKKSMYRADRALVVELREDNLSVASRKQIKRRRSAVKASIAEINGALSGFKSSGIDLSEDDEALIEFFQ